VVEQADGCLGAGGLAGAARVMRAITRREDVCTTTKLAVGRCRAAWAAIDRRHVAGVLDAVTEKGAEITSATERSPHDGDTRDTYQRMVR